MRRTLLLFGCFTLVAAGEAFAAVGAPDPNLAATLFRLSGMERQIGDIAPGIDQQLAASADDSLPAETRERLRRAMHQAFDGNRLHKSALAHLTANMDAARARRAMQWLRSETGRHITRLEEKASDPSSMKALEKYAAALAATPPDPTRLALVQRLDSVAGGTDLTTNVLYEVALATARGFLAASPDRGAGVDLEAAMSQQRPAFEEAARGMTLVSMLFTYRDVSHQDLTAYVDFLGTDAGRWYQKTTSDALMVALRGGAQRLSASLGLLAKPAH